MTERECIDKAVSRGFLKMGRQYSGGQYDDFIQMLGSLKQILAEDGLILDMEEQVGKAFSIHGPVGSIYGQRSSFLDGDAVGAAIVFFADGTANSASERVMLGAVRLHTGKNWVFSGGVMILDRNGRNMPASVDHVIRLVLARKLEHDNALVMA